MNKLLTEMRAARRAAGLSQDDMAAEGGVSRVTLNRMETGVIDPRLSTVEVLARSLGLEVMLVPSSLRPDLQAFIQSGGRMLGQPAGVDAPRSIVDTVLGGRKPVKPHA